MRFQIKLCLSSELHLMLSIEQLSKLFHLRLPSPSNTVQFSSVQSSRSVMSDSLLLLLWNSYYYFFKRELCTVAHELSTVIMLICFATFRLASFKYILLRVVKISKSNANFDCALHFWIQWAAISIKQGFPWQLIYPWSYIPLS